jgi:hypothetical protein
MRLKCIITYTKVHAIFTNANTLPEKVVIFQDDLDEGENFSLPLSRSKKSKKSEPKL